MIVQTKITIPPVRNDIVDRSRLMHLLDEGMRAKLTFLSAPAGYGKTTALSEWARQQEEMTAWVSLDQHDDDWAPFWSYFTASIQERIPGYGQTVWPMLDKGPTASSASPEPAIQAMLNELSQISGELSIILDDVHLITHPAIHQSLSYLLEHLPAPVHLYLASRTELPIPTARLLAKGEFHRITIQDLRFQPEEGLAYFRDRTELSLSRAQVAKLCQQTEGWVSGLQLAAISIKQSGHIAESIQAFGGNQQRISDYLLEEVFSHQPEEIRRFMLRTSTLSRMNHSLCEAVTEQKNSQELLEQLERSHLFLIPLDEHRLWYRYHHLMSDFLNMMFSRQPIDEQEKTHVRAAAWLESHGFPEEAAEHYWEGRQYEDVVRLIEMHLAAFIHKKSAALSRWILQVPEFYLSGRPLLEIYSMHLMIATRQWESLHRKAEQTRIHYEARQTPMNDMQQKAILGDVYAVCAISCYLQKDLEQTADYLIKADLGLTKDSLFIRAGSNTYFGLEEFDDHLAYINDHHAAAAYLRKMMEHWGPGKEHPYAAPLYASYSKLLVEWNRLEEAEAWINQVLRPNEAPTNPRNVFHVYIAAARIQQARGNPDLAQEWIEQLKGQIDSPDYDLFMRKIEAEQAWLSVRQGDIAYGEQWLKRCGMADADEVSLAHVSEHLTLARVWAACGRTEEALRLSEKLVELLIREDRLRDRIQLIILQSIILYRIGKKKTALYRLETALRLAEPQGFIRSFMEEGSVMEALLTDYVQVAGGAPALMDYARNLLQAFPKPQKASKSPDPIKISCFGRFQVTSGQGEEIRWRTSKTEELMAYLVHHRGKPVSRDRILESLWGHVDTVKAGGLLHTTVYYLRKNLNAIGLEEAIQHARGNYLMQADRLDCDCDNFQRLLSDAIPLQIEQINVYVDKLEKLYQTGYLQSNDFPWAEETRSLLEGEYLRKLIQISEWYVQKGKLSSAIDLLKRILISQPLNEDVHARLIQSLLLAGDRVSATKQYDRLEHMLQAELGVEPKESLKQLLDRSGSL